MIRDRAGGRWLSHTERKRSKGRLKEAANFWGHAQKANGVNEAASVKKGGKQGQKQFPSEETARQTDCN